MGLIQNIEKHVSLEENEKEIILSFFVTKKLKKKQFLLQEGDVMKFESFVVKGCLRSYEVTAGGNEHVVQFAIEDWWIGDLYSFLCESPSNINIECLEDCELLQISKTSLEDLYVSIPKLERFFRLLIQNAFIASQRRLLSTISKTAQDRYIDFIKKYPNIEQRVANHQIASYLGIAPESLSRIRNQIATKR